MSVQTLRTAILVTLVTLLIWVYAESESLRTEDLAATIGFSPPRASGPAVWLADAPDRPSIEIRLRVEGATAAIDVLRDQLHAIVLLTPGVELPKDAAEHSIDLRAALRANSIFAKSGVTIAEVSPTTVTVRVDDMTSVQRPVHVELPPGTETVGPPEVQPGLATIAGPASILQALGDQPVLASLDPSSLTPLTPGRLERVSGVPLQIPAAIRGQPFVTVDPKAATVTVTLHDQTDSIDLPTVPVQIRISPVAYAEWDVQIPQDSRFLRNVHVTGPGDVIAQIREGKLPIIAYISLTPEDLTRGVTTKEAVFTDIPNGSLRFEVEDRTIRLQITPRIQSDEAGPPGRPDGPPPA